MLAHVRHEFDLQQVLPPGQSTKREHLESVERQTGTRPKALDGPPMPLVLRHVWDLWLDVHHGRGYGDMGPQPIGFRDLVAWERLRHVALEPIEVDLILAIDREWLASRMETTPRTS